MNTGDKVVCRRPEGYAFTEGKEYTAAQYEPRTPDGHFTWPAYLHVVDDNGRMAVCHANRFQPVKELENESNKSQA